MQHFCSKNGTPTVHYSEQFGCALGNTQCLLIGTLDVKLAWKIKSQPLQPGSFK
jgi:hypothetical protein